MISYEDAIAMIAAEAGKSAPGTEGVVLAETLGRVCAEDVAAPAANQPFDNAAMDGYALRAEDLAAAANDNPVILDVTAHIAAGDGRAFASLRRGQCCEIMTGAPLPSGCNAVVPVEKTVRSGSRITFTARAEEGDNIRRAGEDFRAGDVAVEKGTVLNEGHILALATLGIGRVRVFRKPAAAFVSTGMEVIDDLSAPLKPGQIYNSTRPYLEAALASSGAEVCFLGTVSDDLAAFKEKLREMMDRKADIAVSTGAVSAGTHDFVPSVLKETGAEIFFHKVAIRPGKPLIFARLPSGALFFGLPGNPAASAAGLRFFIRPAIRAMQGLPPEKPLHAVLESPYGKGHGMTQFARVRISCGDDAGLRADIPAKQQSFMVRPFTGTNGWAVIPAGAESIPAGVPVGIFIDDGCVFSPCTGGTRRY